MVVSTYKSFSMGKIYDGSNKHLKSGKISHFARPQQPKMDKSGQF